MSLNRGSQNHGVIECSKNHGGIIEGIVRITGTGIEAIRSQNHGVNECSQNHSVIEGGH